MEKKEGVGILDYIFMFITFFIMGFIITEVVVIIIVFLWNVIVNLLGQ